MKKNYLIPCKKRFTTIGNTRIRTTLRVVDGVGLYVYHDELNHPTPDEIRRHLIGQQDMKMLIQANSVEEALEEFYNEEGTKSGGKHKALTIADSKTNPVIEYTGCKHMGNRNGGINCEYFDDEFTEPDSSLLCVLDGMDNPHYSCVIHRQMEDDRKELKKIGGVWVQFYHKTTNECKGINVTKFEK